MVEWRDDLDKIMCCICFGFGDACGCGVCGGFDCGGRVVVVGVGAGGLGQWAEAGGGEQASAWAGGEAERGVASGKGG